MYMMKKVLVLSTSDVLGIPAILRLKQSNALAALAITDKVAHDFLPILENVGFKRDEVYVLSHKNLERELTALITNCQPDALFTITFSWMIPSAILNLLPNRCINFHFGLLPKYKGAEPVFWQIKNGEPFGGITIHVMTVELDGGPILMVEELPIYPGETYGLNAERLGALAADVVTKVVNGLDTMDMLPVTQPEGPSLFLKAPTHADQTINWEQQTATQIEQLVNASNPRYAGAITVFRKSKIYFLEVSPADLHNPNNDQLPPGTIVHADLLYGLVIACINKEFIKINIVCMQQGYFSGSKLFSLGFRVGEVFG